MIKIPILNIYYMLCYSWNILDEQDIVEVEQIDKKDVLNLFASVLCNGITYLLQRGLDRSYVIFEEDSRTIRGKIDFSRTLKKQLLRNAQVACIYDDLSHNVLHNQILKSTLKLLMRHEDIDEDNYKRCMTIYFRMNEIKEFELNSLSFKKVQLNRNNQFYRFLLEICRMILENVLISEESGENQFKDFFRDEYKMGRLFEDFVRNFYAREFPTFEVTPEQIKWNAISHDDMSKDLLPIMKTDISMVTKDRKIIIDTKFYKEALTLNYDKERLISGNLFQIFSYLKNIESKGELGENCTGILLYPTVNDELNLHYSIPNHELFVKTVDLNQDWESIHNRLLEIIAN